MSVGRRNTRGVAPALEAACVEDLAGLDRLRLRRPLGPGRRVAEDQPRQNDGSNCSADIGGPCVLIIAGPSSRRGRARANPELLLQRRGPERRALCQLRRARLRATQGRGSSGRCQEDEFPAGPERPEILEGRKTTALSRRVSGSRDRFSAWVEIRRELSARCRQGCVQGPPRSGSGTFKKSRPDTPTRSSSSRTRPGNFTCGIG